MPLLVNSVPNLVQGVSQQPDSLRHPAQSDEQINAFSSVVEGLIKRPSTEFVSKLYDDNTNASSLFTHFVKRDENTKYCITVSLGNVSLGGVGVFNLEDGTNYPVAVTSIAGSYLSLGSSVTNPLADLRALTVADYTFLVNKKRVVEKSANSLQKSIVPKDEALIVVKLGDYEKAYSIYIDDNLVGTAPALASRHSVTHDSTSIADAPPSTYISGPAGTTSNSAHLSNHPGLYADTELIAKDLETCLGGYLTEAGISSVDVTNGGTGWFFGASTGPNQSFRTDDVTFRLILTIKQPSTGSTAKASLSVVNGVIQDNAEILYAGTGFDSSVPISNSDLTFRPQYQTPYRVDNAVDADLWRDFTNEFGILDSMTGTAPTLSINFSNRAAFDIERNGSVIRIRSTDGPFKVRVEDGLADQALGAVYREVNSITDLPAKCYNNFIVKVIGDADIDQDDYYVRFTTKEKDDFGEGTWVETVGFYHDGSPLSPLESLDTALASDTMPVTLVPFFKNGDINNFRLQTPNEILIVKQGATYYRLDKDHTAANSNKPGVGADWEDFWTEVPDTTQGYLDWEADVYYYGPTETTSGSGWGGRSAGDDFTNPFPSFVGKQIRDIFFFKNRLGILTDSNVIFSEADEYYNFFRTTTQQLLDSAPIDVGLSHTKVARLKYAKAFQEKLMLFSDTSQFTLRGADVLSPKTVAISPVSEYDVSDVVEPLALGNYIYFPFKRDKYEGVYEYFVDNNTEVFTAQEITEQVPKYIRSNVIRMAGSSIQNVLVLQSDRDDSELYIYKYFWSNNEKVQSAWQRFDLRHCNIRGFQFIDSILYLVTEVNDTIQLEKLSFEDAQEESVHALHSFRGNLGYPLLLDSKVVNDAASLSPSMSSSYDATANLTTITGIDIYIPPAESETTLELWTTNGKKYDVTRVSDTSVEFEGAIYDYVSYEGTIYKCMLSHNSSFYPEFNGTPDNYKPGGSQTLWNTLTGDEAALVTSASDWQEDRWYQGPHDFVVGYSYGMLYRFSDQTLKQPTERGGRTTSDYTFQSIKNGSVQYSQSGSMQVAVTPKYRDRFVYTFNPDSVGSNLFINKFTPQDGHFRFPVQTQAEDLLLEVRSESALPLRLLSAEFESLVVSRSRRYGA